MADWHQEAEAAIELAIGAIDKLKAKDPNHELLKWENSFFLQHVPQDFYDRFGGKNVAKEHQGTVFAIADMINNYFKALEAAAA